MPPAGFVAVVPEGLKYTRISGIIFTIRNAGAARVSPRSNLEKGETKMQKEAQSRSRSLLIVLAGAIGIVLFGFFLMRTQYHLVKKDLQDEMKENSSYIREAFSS